MEYNTLYSNTRTKKYKTSVIYHLSALTICVSVLRWVIDKGDRCFIYHPYLSPPITMIFNKISTKSDR